MLAKLRSRLTFANVVSLLALFVALSGGAYALTIPKNSVGTKQLKKNAVTGPKVKKGAISSPKVRDGSLLAEDFKAGELPVGTRGPQGESGPPGPPGPGLHTFADTSVSGGIALNGTDQVVATTAGQPANANGAVGGALRLPGGNRFALIAAVEVKHSGGGGLTCALQGSANGGAFADQGLRASGNSPGMRFSVPEGTFLSSTSSEFQIHYRVVCTGGGTVTDTDLSVIAAYTSF